MPRGAKGCPPGCDCWRHAPAGRARVGHSCPPGCTCGRHARKGTGQSREELYEKQRQWRAANPERVREKVSEWRAKNPQWQRDYQAKNGRKQHYRHTYGLEPEQLTQMYEAQDGCCYLCSEPLDLESRRGFAVDHDHSCCRGRKSCGRCIRGLACDDCNVGIARFADDPERMIRAATRLAEASARVAALRARKPVQGELFPNVTQIRREATG